MLGNPFNGWRGRVSRLVHEPHAELNRGQRTLRFTYLLGLHGAKRLGTNRAQEMAAALSFRTLFGLLPVLVVGTLVVRALSGWDRFYASTERLLLTMGLGEIRVFAGAGQTGSQTLSQWLLDLLSQVESINVTAIGWVGVGVLVYSALGLMVTIENSFNTIYHAPRGRSWVRRVPNYWFVLCLAPAGLAAIFYVDGKVERAIQDVQAWDGVIGALGWSWSLLLLWLIVFIIYRMVPNTFVAAPSAALGAAVAALFLSLGKASLGAYMENAISIRQLYGSLGLIPLFMFWVYLMWMVVMWGLEIAAAHQTVSREALEERKRKPEPEHEGFVDPLTVVALTRTVAQRFAEGHPTSERDLVESLGLPLQVVQHMTGALVEHGILHRLDRNENTYALAQPPEAVGAGELLHIGYELTDRGRESGAQRWLEQLRNAQTELAARSSLATLLRD